VNSLEYITFSRIDYYFIFITRSCGYHCDTVLKSMAQFVYWHLVAFM